MPHTDPLAACAVVNKYLPAIPYWPQLPKRSNLENMYIQFSEGFPGIVINGDKIQVIQGNDFDARLEQLYTADSENNSDSYALSKDYAAGLKTFLDLDLSRDTIAKGQVTGPISWGLAVTDAEQRGILYDELLAEALARFLRLKSIWQENELRKISSKTIIFFDEPYLTSLGSAFVAIPDAQVKDLLEIAVSGVKGIKGVHCCGSTNWSLLLTSSIDILNFDAYNYADSLTTYVNETLSFLNRGGVIAWGIVPNDEEMLAKESVSTLYDRLGEAIAPFTRDGFPFKQLVAQGLLTPSCGLASLSLDAAQTVLQLLSELSDRVRTRYSS
jgi:methionine synthase II (cobalamin-independent)